MTLSQSYLLCTLRLLRCELLRLALASSLLRQHRCELCVVGLIDLACQREALRDLQAPRECQARVCPSEVTSLTNPSDLPRVFKCSASTG